MTALSKGANTDLPAGPITVTVTAQVQVDVAALSLRADGKVRGDVDFVFYNQPQGAGVRHVPGPHDSVVVDTAAVPADVDKVVVTASLDGSGPATFGAAGAVSASIDATGPVATYQAEGLGAETALIVVELYRRGDGWKVRAVGQGYANGLAGIASDFGIEVDESPAAQAVPPAPASSPPAASHPSPAAPPPVAIAPPPATHPAPAATPGVVNLDKGRVSLQKKQTVSLVKTGAPPLETVLMGLGWDPAKRGGNIDLDAGVIAYGAGGQLLERVFFGNLGAYLGALRHLGDNLTGQGDGDDEQIVVDLQRLPPEVLSLVFTVNSYRKQRFTEVRNAYCRLVDKSGAELVRFDLSDSQPSTGVFMCRMRRAGASWEMTALGEFHDGRTVKEMVGPGARFA